MICSKEIAVRAYNASPKQGAKTCKEQINIFTYQSALIKNQFLVVI